jgi:hypothetical protein
MNEKQLDRAIQSVGKSCFVKYFENFRDSNQKYADLVELLKREENYTENASKTRVSKARNIITNGHAEEILVVISKSGRLDDDIIKKAKDLLRKYYS